MLNVRERFRWHPPGRDSSQTLNASADRKTGCSIIWIVAFKECLFLTVLHLKLWEILCTSYLL